MNESERRVAVLHAVGHDPQRDEVVHLLELDPLPLQLLVDAPQPFDAAVDCDDRHLGLGELRRDRVLELLDEPFGRAPPRVDSRAQRLVRLRLEVPERQLLQLVLQFAHAETIGDRRVDVSRLLRDLDAPIFRQVIQRPHVVKAVAELDDDHADVVDHREQHLAEVLGLPLLARRKRNGADLGDAFDDVRDLRPEEFLDALDRRQGVFDHVVQQAGGDGDRVELHVGEEIGDRERVYQIGLAGMAHLSAVLEGGEHVRSPEQFDVGVRAVGPDFVQQILEANHRNRCLSQ